MKLKFLPILAGTTLGWSLPPTNYTNPCEDFHVSRSSLLKGKTLSVHETTNGEPECEELCRNDEKCVGFNFIKSKCFLKSSLGSELKLKMSISGKKFKPDYNGDPLKVNLCPIYLKAKQCDEPPSCYNAEVRERCGVRGVKVDKNHCVLPGCECNEEKDSYIVNGDIMVTKKDQKQTRGIYKPAKLWKGGVVPYRKTNYPHTDHWYIIDEGVRALERGTCLRFVEHTNERDYVDIIYGDGCTSHIGKAGGRQELSLGPGCAHQYIVSHEFMHALGFNHEQNRGDQAEYVRIHYENIDPGLHFAFEVMKDRDWNPLGYAYDIHSVMQYDGYGFSINGQPTITLVSTGEPTPLNTVITHTDYAQINALYCGGPEGDGGLQPPSDCRDEHQDCAFWASIGECTINPDYMLVYCKKSCNVCCADEHPDCEHWASIGECAINPGYMLEHCKQSCNVC